MCCCQDVSRGEEKKKRRRILSNSGCEDILNCLLGKLEKEIDVERRNYLCRQCADKSKKRKRSFSLLRESFLAVSVLQHPPLSSSGTVHVQRSSSLSPAVAVTSQLSRDARTVQGFSPFQESVQGSRELLHLSRDFS